MPFNKKNTIKTTGFLIKMHFCVQLLRCHHPLCMHALSFKKKKKKINYFSFTAMANWGLVYYLRLLGCWVTHRTSGHFTAEATQRVKRQHSHATYVHVVGLCEEAAVLELGTHWDTGSVGSGKPDTQRVGIKPAYSLLWGEYCITVLPINA